MTIYILDGLAHPETILKNTRMINETKSINNYLVLPGLGVLSMPTSDPNLEGPLSSDLSPFSNSKRCLSRFSEARYGPGRKKEIKKFIPVTSKYLKFYSIGS